ncbi:hypothetical protein SLS57_010789 [Botryosphaeria dothidea]
MAAPLGVNSTTETTSLSERDIPLQNPGITVFYSKQQMPHGRFRARFRLMGFLQATGPMLDVLKERMDVSGGTSQPVERASVIAQAFFAHFRARMDEQFPFRNFNSMRALFNAGGAGNDAWEGTIGAQFESFSSQATFDKIMDALKAYLTTRGSNSVGVVFEPVTDAFTVGSPTEYALPKRKTRSTNTCSSTTSILSLFQDRVPEVPSYFGETC